MTPVEKDRVYLEAGIPELEEYLLSKELYWPISARGYSLPRLTIGGLLLTQATLEARGEWTDSFVAQLDAVRTRWRVAWETKVINEVKARMRLWINYLADYRQNPDQHADVYPHEVRSRVMLHLLLADLPTLSHEQEVLSELDGLLRVNLIASEFIWESSLQSGFPRDKYWYLYGKLRS